MGGGGGGSVTSRCSGRRAHADSRERRKLSLVFGGPHPGKTFSGSEKYLVVDPGDDFAMDNGKSKKPLRSDRGVRMVH